MLATLIIGLREGLEAALIVGIVAAFLKRSGRSLRPLAIGVAAAVLLSILVGVLLEALQTALPQSQQEALETVIGAVAVVFVTTMILWMRTHGRDMHHQLEARSEAALGRGGSLALAGMAFLAVLKEGFETAVFLLATMQAETSGALGLLGAVIGILAAGALGWGLYQGGIRFNLSRFFTITGVFLVLVAAGLVFNVLRTAHEAGWITIGQRQMFDLSWLVPAGSIRSAVITGVFGIPADPRLIEVLGWLLYAVPVTLLLLLPARLRLSRRQRLIAAGALGLAAVVLAVGSAVTTPAAPTGTRLMAGKAAVTAHGDGAALRLTRAGSATMVLRAAGTEQREDVAAHRWRRVDRTTASHQLSYPELVALNGGRRPIGIDPTRAGGPYRVEVQTTAITRAWTADGGALLDAAQQTTALATIAEGGLGTPRTMTLAAPAGTAWRVDARASAAALAAQQTWQHDVRERQLYIAWLPLVLLGYAIALSVPPRNREPVSPRREQPAAVATAS